MTITLPKGGNFLLTDEAPGIERVRIGLGWSDGPSSAAVEVDGVVLVVDAAASSRMLLAHQVPNPSERPGAAPPPRPLIGDAEKLVVTLAAVPAEISRLQFGATIYDARDRHQTFQSAREAYVRVLNDADSVEIARYTFEAETGRETTMLFGEIYRHAKGWKFRAIGQGYDNGLLGLAGANHPDVATEPPGEVAAFLSRTSRARSRRNVAEHLHPRHAAAPPPAPPAPAPRPAAPRRETRRTVAPPARPAGPPRSHPLPPPAKPAPAPAPTPTPSAPAAARSPLDLSEAAPAAARPSRAHASPRGASPLTELGERSSRYRQRGEHVSALDDDHPATTWTPQKRGTGTTSLTLHWTPLLTHAGLPRPSDIHLGALWQASDGTAGVMQDLRDAVSAPGGSAPRQVLRLGRRDEREGQTIFVNVAALATFKRFFVFAHGLHGAPEWALLRPVLTIDARTGEHLTIRLGDAPSSARTCVVASFHLVGDDVVIRRENDFLDGTQTDAAARYGWSLEWNPDGTTLRDTP